MRKAAVGCAGGPPLVASCLLFAAVLSGTEQTNWAVLIMSVAWGRPKVIARRSNRRF
jgi:hypothetical protein